jgi:phenylpropionate dioxygenase-like ring-hydroxylating dioxygenase large terminal subunit
MTGSSTFRRTPTEKAPEPDLGSAPIPKERYTSADFERLETERLWPRVWLLAGREADLARAGDYFTFEIAGESLLVVRDRGGQVRAHHNVCQHRGNRLCDPGRGHVPVFSCRYHAWEWNLDGTLRRATDAETFPQGLPPDLRLAEVRADTWGGWVWVNMSPDAEPLRDYLGVLPDHLDVYRFPEQALVDDVTVEVDCNWKTSVDAFNEAYHIQGTHPELLEWSDDVDVQIDLYGPHSRFIFKLGLVSPRLGRRERIPEPIREILMRGAGLDPDAFTGTLADVRPAIAAATRRQGADLGIDYAALTDEQLLDDYHYTIFPNVTLNVHGRGFWLFRHRPHPTDPHRMLFDFQNHLHLPRGMTHERPAHRQHRHGEISLGQVLDQDLDNLPRVQAGMRSRGFQGLLLNSQERRVRHFHRVLDHYLYGTPP